MEPKDFDLEQSFPVEKSNKGRDLPNSKETSPDKNATYIGLLATFCGFLGVHDLNCGNMRNGVLKLIFSCLGFTSIISFFWTISDLIKLGNGTYKAANGIELGKAPWCKIVALIELILFAATLAVAIYFVSIFIMGAAFSK